MVKLILFNLLLFGCWFYALRRGAGPEKLASTVFVVGSLLTAAVAQNASDRFGSVELGILAVDIAALLAFLAIAILANRFWPLWLTALQAIGTAAHAVRVADPELIRWGYAFALAFWSYPMLLLIIAGTWNHRRRLARFGADRSWSTSLGRWERKPRPGPTG